MITGAYPCVRDVLLKFRAEVGNFVIDEWAPGKVFGGQIDGGYPLAVFDSTMSLASVLSPLNTFMSANQYSFKDNQSGDTLITFGPMSSIDTVRHLSLPLLVFVFFFCLDSSWLHVQHHFCGW